MQTITISVALPQSVTVAVVLLEHWTVWDLKERVRELGGMGLNSFKLTCGGEELPEGASVVECGIGEEVVCVESFGLQDIVKLLGVYWKGSEAEHYAADCSYSEEISGMLNAAVCGDEAVLREVLHCVAWCGFPKCTELLLSQYPTLCDSTALHHAAATGNWDVVQLLKLHSPQAGMHPRAPLVAGVAL